MLKLCNIKQNIHNLDLAKNVLDTTPKSWSIKFFLNYKLDFTKMKNVCPSKETIKKMKRVVKNWLKNFQIICLIIYSDNIQNT